MEQQFPRTTVGGVSLSRMLIGTNWMLGYSHTSASAAATTAPRPSSPCWRPTSAMG